MCGAPAMLVASECGGRRALAFSSEARQQQLDGIVRVRFLRFFKLIGVTRGGSRLLRNIIASFL